MEPCRSGHGYGYDHLGFAVANLYETYQQLTAKGCTFSVPPADPSARMAFVRGPDNLEIELWQPA